MNFHLQSPIKPKNYDTDAGLIQLTQMFGEDPERYAPLKGHTGWDFRTKHFQDGRCPVLAAHDGTIITDKNAWDAQGGKYIKIMSGEVIINGQVGKALTFYCHLASTRLERGAKVKAGQLIGYAGNTGLKSTGYHLHFDFTRLLKCQDGTFEYPDAKDKYGDRCDPLPYMIDGNVFQYGDGLYSRMFFYNGKKIQREEVDHLIPEQFIN
jgi:murein DD-endopeptidase MepM/ murein hydrolase activator NlpD